MATPIQPQPHPSWPLQTQKHHPEASQQVLCRRSVRSVVPGQGGTMNVLEDDVPVLDMGTVANATHLNCGVCGVMRP
ncbi:hypothetical protein P691DRAFT_578632 [Macrolepiota fuliginosa MF-IS2]|uniref:Uncharacterized protein n=1 Tax=Macrolepiota fuliginosa MF-IS2 TaxID=1400762 RepID=A0A9P6BXB7_9AGAR|nr:hypothetical protein P691DRAFT_578632 [Macrolepiota fuliginosa MF-IS2]